MKVILIVGLPGSGKTHLARKLVQNQGLKLFDDIDSLDQLFCALKNQESCIITDPNLCDPSIRAKALKILKENFEELTLEWIFFKNDPESCRKNVAFRNDGRDVEATIKRFSKVYEVPEGVQSLDIWNSEYAD